MATNVKKRKKRRGKKVAKSPLTFKENEFEGIIHSSHIGNRLGLPIEVPTRKIDYFTSSNWVSPQVQKDDNCISRTGMHTRSRRVRPKIVKLSGNHLVDQSYILENQPIVQIYIPDNQRNDQCYTPESEDASLDFPLPNNLSTPEITTPIRSSFLQEKLHFIFQGETPIEVNNRTVLVKDTPMAS